MSILKRIIRKLLGQDPDYTQITSAWFRGTRYNLLKEHGTGAYLWYNVHRRAYEGPSYYDETMAISRFGEWFEIPKED